MPAKNGNGSGKTAATVDASAKTTKVEALMDKLSKELERIYATTDGVLHEGDRIVIPVWMSYRDAAAAILQHEKTREEVVNTTTVFDAHPNDALVGFNEALSETFGAVLGIELDMGFWGTLPGQHIDVVVGYDEDGNLIKKTVPVGHTEIQGLPIVMDIGRHDNGNEVGGELVVRFEYKNKYKPLVDHIVDVAQKYLKTHSIFKGKAIDSRFEFLNLSHFRVDKLIYSEIEGAAIEAMVLAPIRHTAFWRRNGKSLKRGNLLFGRFGTGKTLTARYVAMICQQNGWTFVQVRPGDDLTRSLNFAKRYQPAVVFVEDLDAETGLERDEDVNRVLNTIDGILSKDSEVITIMTTNHVEAISKGMLRPGRIDGFIEMGIVDKQQVIRLCNANLVDDHGNSILVGELDEDAIYEAAKDYTPAFIVGALEGAFAYALGGLGSDATEGDYAEIAVTSDEIVRALKAKEAQWKLINDTGENKKVTLDSVVSDVVRQAVADKQEAMKNGIATLMEEHDLDASDIRKAK
jgi:transitional endoplasmic reticulum ATPase